MGYIEKKVLTKTDSLQFFAKINPIFLIFSWIWGILGCWLLLIPTFKAIKKTVFYFTTEYAVTTKKVIEKYGWVATHTDEMPLDKIENLTVNYNFFGKIFNYGNLCIQGTNRNDITFKNIKSAETVKRDISELMERNNTKN